jgi:hypothetical protein
MHGFLEKFAPGVFGPEDAKILTQAFDDAWARVRASKDSYLAEEYTVAGRAILAKHIINVAKAGERDPRVGGPCASLSLATEIKAHTAKGRGVTSIPESARCSRTPLALEEI